MSDTLTHIGDTLVQQGRFNERLSVLRLARQDVPWIIDRLKEIAEDNGYSKILVRAPESRLSHFKSKGYMIEAMIPGFFHGSEDGYFLARYLKHSRKQEYKKIQARQVMRKAMTMACLRKAALPEAGLRFYLADRNDAGELAVLYKTALDIKPFQDYNEAYLKKTMENGVRYYYVRHKGEIIASLSARIDTDVQNVELADLVTHPDFSMNGVSGFLLCRMDEEMRAECMKVSYTTVRALAYPVNAVFAREGYFYCGTLVNNTRDSECFESANVWYKPLVKKSL
ncbi:putative beta-lysine N-acetyltransferase [Methanocella arvoryzae]|uniref:N-acetyltransferase domain-containing protein n=1 Tax=Methanocella arvoryzae (strain DSM 22066 / NBRC 105507 / MRE50) TaxID=351160 RepID=Q0W0J0_METAR|nr:putative beta-lysine N-acetyltransferase [Methanocella arvoryzae]CAJ38103.1 conserved hypothetical protein [Methanocella arvoryzae MRE50]